MWELRAGALTGEQRPRRDFELRKDGKNMHITVVLPWPERGPSRDRDGQVACAKLFLEIAKDIAGQTELPLR